MVAGRFIGLGNMGGSMTRHLLNDVRELTAFEVDAETRERRGRRRRRGRRFGAQRSEVVFLSLLGPEPVR
ncbi:NAD(P)-binding domain-containing protein [Halalkalicoccus sp. NIPERK01]|uniref:NAD(P)-binding domain-containing protein n=1 Tax=Halalkalicoccus sp. NIPERK01 TaxID=3053469 RepID=UPI0034E96764